MSDELIKRVSGVILGELRYSGAFVGNKSTETGLPLVEGFVDLDDLALAAINEVLHYQTTEVIERMTAGRPMPDEPGHPDVYVVNGPSLHGEDAQMMAGRPMPPLGD
jgi:hypothetical protein